MRHVKWLRRVITPIVVFSALAFAGVASATPPTPPFTQCPPVGADTSCGTLIVINSGGSVEAVNDPSQGPFDGIEDTMIGVQNNSGSAVSSIALEGLFIFGFDGDGICNGYTPAPPACPYGTTGYEGPGTEFTITNSNEGSVNFVPTGLAAGASTYFSLEEAVTCTGVSGGVQCGTATDEQISATGGFSFVGVTGTPVSGTVATFTDPDTAATASEYSASIKWGDGNESTGTISGSSGSFSVSGEHTYSSAGSYTITVTITDVDNESNTATVTDSALIGGTTAGGNFVIGDKKSATGTAVTFWGAQWWKLNPMTAQSVQISSFKGFEDKPATAGCNTSWTTDPGNSTPPPAGPLPAYMVVLVSSKIAPNGARVTGNIVHEVIVKTNPGYAPDPGHVGTGTVVAQIC
jgi:hypothetical protein